MTACFTTIAVAKCSKLNEDHSMAPQIDFMVQSGLLDAEAGKNHPDRNCLTSVILATALQSTAPRRRSSCRSVTLSSSATGCSILRMSASRILHRYRRKKAAEIAGYLLEAIEVPPIRPRQLHVLGDQAEPQQASLSAPSAPSLLVMLIAKQRQ